MVPRRMLAAIVAALLLAAPAPALAQSAGDEQYQDPFGGNSGGSDSSGGGSGSQAPSTPSTPAPAPSASATTPAQPSPTTAQAAPSAAQLPYTGSPVAAAWLAALGATMVVGGLTLRVRLRERDRA